MRRQRSTLWLLAILVLVATPAWSATTKAQKILDRWAKGKTLRGLQVGVSVIDAQNGQTLAGRHATTVMNPASGTKLLTSAAALALLPLEPKWRTSLHGIIEDSRLQGPLRVVGGGDPKLLIAHVEQMAEAVLKSGVKAIPEGLVLHLGHFDTLGLPPAYEQKQTDAGYRPSVGALASNFGAVRVSVRPAKRVGGLVRVSVEGGPEAVDLSVSAKTVQGTKDDIAIRSIQRQDGSTQIVVSGSLGKGAKATGGRKRLYDPNLWTGRVLRHLLIQKGVEVGDAITVSLEPLGHDAGPALLTVSSRSLPETLEDINTWSNNFMAEMVLKQMGCEVATPCTWERGVMRATEALSDLGVPEDAFTFVNGSGLYRATMASPLAMTTLLVKMRADPLKFAAFDGSLAVSGKPGTLRGRLTGKGTRGKVRGKTGTLNEVVSLSGYLPTRRGRTLAFSVIVNGATPKRTSAIRRKIDQLVRRLTKL